MRDANLRLCCDTLAGHGQHASSCVGKHGEATTMIHHHRVADAAVCGALLSDLLAKGESHSRDIFLVTCGPCRMGIAPRKDDGHQGGAPPKRRWGLLPWDALGDVVDVLTWACTRKEPPPYGEESWREVPDAIVRYEHAMLRHFAEWHEGRRLGRRGREVVDKQSGFPTLAHAACCALFLLALDRRE